jgi:hypothetical protein
LKATVGDAKDLNLEVWKEYTMLAGKKEAEAKSNKEDLEFAVSMLKVKLQATTGLSEKIRLYNQIKALQENISKLESKGSARS